MAGAGGSCDCHVTREGLMWQEQLGHVTVT